MALKEPTHVVFDGEKIVISTNLTSIFRFLIGIGKEIEEMIGLKKIVFPRSQMICLFAYMETIFCIMTIYDREIVDEKSIINFANKDLETLIGQLILSNENGYYKDNKDRLGKINAQKLKDFRNHLTHFYSVSNFIQIVINDKDRKIEKILNKDKFKDVICMSPEELYELLKAAIKLIWIKRAKDTAIKPEVFERKIGCVMSVINLKAAVLSEGKIK